MTIISRSFARFAGGPLPYSSVTSDVVTGMQQQSLFDLLSSSSILTPFSNLLTQPNGPLKTFFGIDTASQVENLIKSKEVWFSNLRTQLLSDPTVLATMSLLNQGSIELFGTQDASKWVKHFLSISMSETGGLLNPDAYFEGTANFQGHKLPAHAYGLLQQTPGSWSDSIDVISRQPWFQNLKDSGYLKALSSALGTRYDQFINPLVEYGPANSELLQIVPNLGAMKRLKDEIAKRFTFTPDGWLPKDADLANGAAWSSFFSRYKDVLSDPDLGEQALATIMHANGPGWLTLKKPLSYLQRPEEDVKNYIALTMSSSVGQWLNQIPELTSFMFGAKIPPTQKKTVLKPSPILPEGGDPYTNATSSGFGWRTRNGKKEFHNGIDISLPAGTPVYAPGSGIVTVSDFDHKYGSGNRVIIKMGNGWKIGYAHLLKPGLPVGTKVIRGTQVGLVGRSGLASGYHLHFTTRNLQGLVVDPFSSPFTLDYLIHAI